MFVFLVRRVLLLSAVVVGLSFGAFALVYYGKDYEGYMVGCEPGYHFEQCDPEYYAVLREITGVDRPIVVEFADYVCGGLCVPDARRDGVIRGDFGPRSRWRRDTSIYIRVTLPISAQLGLAALVILYTVGVPLGTLAAVKQGAWIDRWIAVGCTAVKSAPVFVLGPILILVLVLEIMDQPWWDGVWGLFSASSILPVVLVALVAMPLVVRTTRVGVIDALGQDYVRTARAKGLPERMVVSRHVLRTALTPLVSGLVPTLAALLSGLLLVEVLFGILGFGTLFIRSLNPNVIAADWHVVLGGVVLGTAAWAVCSLAADLLHWALDPRIRYHGPVSGTRTAGRALAV